MSFPPTLASSIGNEYYRSARVLGRYSIITERRTHMSKHEFQTEVSQLLHLIIHSLYSHSEIFLRELVSNSSDALDKLKYLTLTDEAFKKLNFDPRVDIILDEKNKTLTISDNGIGMNEEDLVAHLGTIARSGTKNFLKQLTGEAQKDSNLIGQFGVGFYSVFMVADKVEVVSRKAGEEKAYKWISDGKSGYSIEEAQRENQGTDVLLHLNDAGKDYANSYQLQGIVKKYSNHVAFPIFLDYEKTEYKEEGKSETKRVQEQVNSASALWKKAKSAIKDKEYQEFYKSISNDMDDSLIYLHTQAEGTLEYTTLFFVPKKAPMDMFYADYKPGVKLYVKRVFITDDEKELMPTYLRFLRGVIDSEDLPLNVSREILQQNRVLENIKSASVKKVLGELERLAEKDKKKYTEFIQEYNRPLKEGLYSDFANKDTLLKLVRFKSSKVEGLTSLAEYKERMKEDQKGIYYITGEKEAILRNSPLLEAYKKRDIEVLIMDDEIDEVVVPSIGQYEEIDLKAVNKSETADELKEEKDEEKEKELEPLVKKIKDTLGDQVKAVKVSNHLNESPSCIITDSSDPTFQMINMMKQMGNKDLPSIKPILEVNPDHPIIEKMKGMKKNDDFKDAALLLLDQARIMEGLEVEDPAAMIKSLNRILAKAL
jgi:molecular chaperone HtpG